MAEKFPEDFDVDIQPNQPLFIISIVSEMVQIPIWTLRKLDEMGVVEPKRIGKKTRCYSKEQIRTLIYIQHLMDNQGVNISGVKFILELHAHRQEGGKMS
ncbi:MAG: MerR family transcriptional regulator [Candidatus Omnitrophota bacterium]|nr:MerR family transcriptional regulator [Candidatus Omnitrophota bacterium]